MKPPNPLFGAALLLGSFVSVAEAQAPIILAQPTNEVVLAGSTAAFSVAVSGTGPFTYQWQFNGRNHPYGVITTVAGNGRAGYSGDGGQGTSAAFSFPAGVAVDASGNLFIADDDNHVIREVGTNGIMTTVAGNGRNGFSGDGGPGTSAGLSYPSCVAVDASGNLFVADDDNHVIREVGSNGIISTVAGNGNYGYSGDGGAATNAELNYPSGVAADASGHLFVADEDDNVIRKVGANGIIATVAGNGTWGYFGDGGLATKAELNVPSGVAVDASGNLFIADQNNHVIREVGIDGIITTVAGNGTNGFSGDGGAATKAELSWPYGVAVDASGNLFIADSGNSRIREVGTDGIITTVAGNGTNGYSGDGAATNAELGNPLGVAVDASGNLFIADANDNRIRKVVFPGPALVLTNVGGGNAGEYDVVVSSPYGSVTSSVVTLVVLFPPAFVAQPQSRGVAIGSNATLSVAATGTAPLEYQWYLDGAPLEGQTDATLPLSAASFTNAGSYNVVVTNLYGSVTSAVAVVTVGLPPGFTQQPASRTNLFGSTAFFSVAVSGTGPFTYQWQFNGVNLPYEGVITTVAGNVAYGYSGDGGPATSAELNYPQGVAVDAAGNLFIADADNSRIREVGTNGVITTVAGNGNYGYSGDGGAAANAELSNPSGVAVGAPGHLFIADAHNNRIREVGAYGIITTVAGNGTSGYSGDGGLATRAGLSYPRGVAVDASGNLFIADYWNNLIREVETNGIITTVAGNGTNGYSGDGGSATSAELSNPSGVSLDASGNLFIADSGNNVIRQVGTGGIITTIAGNGIRGYSGDGGAGTKAELYYPSGVALDASGNLFIADEDNNVIREVGTDGIITTVAGNGTRGYSGDAGAAIQAELQDPAGVALDASGNLFIADDFNNRIRKVIFPGPRLVLSNVGGTNAGSYAVVVSSPYGSATSSVATLVVEPNPLQVLGTGGPEVQLQFQGVPGNSYVLLSATNLTPPIDWRPVSTNAGGPRGQWTFTVTNVLSSQTRFYRMSSAGQ